MRAAVMAVEIVGGSVWIGGLVTVPIVARIVRRQLEPEAQIRFFRLFGLRYLTVAGCALATALGCGALLITAGGWSGEKSAAVLVAVLLVLATVAGISQARSLTALRSRALDDPLDVALRQSVQRRARSAAVPRAAIGVLTLTLVILAAVMIG